MQYEVFACEAWLKVLHVEPNLQICWLDLNPNQDIMWSPVGLVVTTFISDLNAQAYLPEDEDSQWYRILA